VALVPLEEARQHVLERCRRFTAVPTARADALGLVLAADVEATEQIPPFDNTAMDGYAVRAADTVGAPVTLRVVDTLHAGRAPDVPVGPGEAVRIMTGAPMPTGADAVVMVERTRADGDAAVVIDVTVEPGDSVRWAGDDVSPGDVVLPAGTVLGAAQLGVLASLGVDEVAAYPRARVGVMSTGDELVVGPADLEPGQIRDSNRPALLAAVRAAGCEPVDLGCIPDDDGRIEAAFLDGVGRCDAILSSGGVSMGDVDLVKVVLDRIGAMRWMQIAIKPAKPFAFGVLGASESERRAVPVFGLPGNPVSSLVSFELFARPALRQMMGHTDLDRPTVRAVADEALGRRPDGKTHFFRVVVTQDAQRTHHVRPAGGQGSHQLAAMAAADGLAVVPDGDGVPAGGSTDVFLLA
jgi:molybdenum cofactor synthesis domain-containing protein